MEGGEVTPATVAAADDASGPNVNTGGIMALILFYCLIFVVGMYAGWKGKRVRNPIIPSDIAPPAAGEQEGASATIDGSPPMTEDEDYMLAGRNIGWLVGTFTMTATWVGGGYINGTAEALYDPTKGLIWAQAPWGYALSLVIGGVAFASVMRGEKYITMIDPFQEKFGNYMGVLLFLPALVAETLWSAAILAALGSSVRVILDLSNNISIIGSAVVVIIYTIFGGLYSVAYTDVVQLALIFVGLWICVPFAISNPNVGHIMDSSSQWIGHLDSVELGTWLDTSVLLMLGGIPWQVYFQRVLSAKSPRRSVGLSFAAAVGCVFMAIPAAILGCIGASVQDWGAVSSMYVNGSSPLSTGEGKTILPMVMQHLTPPLIGWVGLGGVSAAVMSSADSSLLSASSMFIRNVYKIIIRPHAGAKELEIALKCSISAVGCLAMLAALSVNSIFDLWVMCSDFVYVLLFPQLLCVIYVKQSNTYGSLAAYILGAIMRISGGVEPFGMPALVKYPDFDEEHQRQLFPFKSLSMISSLLTMLVISLLFHTLFTRKLIPMKWDVLECYHQKVQPTASHEAPVDSKNPDIIVQSCSNVSGNVADCDC